MYRDTYMCICSAIAPTRNISPTPGVSLSFRIHNIWLSSRIFPQVSESCSYKDLSSLSLSSVEINECWVLCQALGGLLTLSDDLWGVSLSLWQLCRGEERLATALLGLSIEGLGMNWALLLCVSIIPTTDPGTSVPEAKEKDPLSKNHYH